MSTVTTLVDFDHFMLDRIAGYLCYEDCLSCLILCKSIPREPFLHILRKLAPRYFFDRVMVMFSRLVMPLLIFNSHELEQTLKVEIHKFFLAHSSLDKVKVNTVREKILCECLPAIIDFYKYPHQRKENDMTPITYTVLSLYH